MQKSRSTSNSPQRHFIGIDCQLASTVADWLIDKFGGRPLDLSAVAVVVPTANSGRLLRAALAAAANRNNTGLLAPVTITPDRFHALLVTDGPPPAGPLECFLAWVRLLARINPNDYPAVFPVSPASRKQTWALGVARRMVELKRLLGEGGFSIAAAASHPATAPEAERWQQLAALEAQYQQLLAASGRADPVDQQIAASRSAAIQPEIRHIVAAAVADPIPRTLDAIKRLAASTSVDILIAANDSDASRFDDWGIPIAGAWSAEISIPDPKERIHLCHNPDQQGERVAALIKAGTDHLPATAIAVCDPDVFDPLLNALQKSGLKAYDPGGEPVQRHPVITFLNILRDWIRDDSIDALAEFLRDPALAAYCDRNSSDDDDGNRLSPLTLFDRFFSKHLPMNLTAAMEIARSRGNDDSQTKAFAAILAKVLALRSELKPGTQFGPTLRSILEKITKALPPASRRDPSVPLILEHATACADELSGNLAYTDISVTDLLDIVLHEILNLRLPSPQPPDAITCFGWLETLWIPHAHLILTGCNDGRLPAGVPGNDFLPNALRQALGLPSDDRRFERDCYMLQVLLAQRRNNGRIDFILGRSSAEGETLLPSRLLLLENETILPARITEVFRDPPAQTNIAAKTMTWRYVPPPSAREIGKTVSSISVTSFSTYLSCPFTFYLRNVLRLEPFQHLKRELDGREFGTLIHDAIQFLNSDTEAAAATGEDVIKHHLHAHFESQFHSIYGGRISLAMQVQFNSAIERLAHAARVIAENRADGWFPEHVEWPFTLDQESPFNRVSVHGRIDLIERNRENGKWRLIDFKSSDSDFSPINAHLRVLRPNTEVPAIACFQHNGTDCYWLSLQLPAYLIAISALTDIDSESVEVGYFNLPRAVNQTGYSFWPDCADYLNAARQSMATIVQCIADRIFWPPARKPAFDVFSKWFPPDIPTACAPFEESFK